jgi:ribosomal protein L37E
MARSEDDKAKSNKKAIKDQAPEKVDQAQVGNDPAAVGPVQPIEVVRGVPEEGNEGAETVTAFNKPNLQESDAPLVTADEDKVVQKEQKAAAKKAEAGSGEDCWNCGKGLDKKGVCASCGFEKDKLYNPNIEPERARERALREQGGY